MPSARLTDTSRDAERVHADVLRAMGPSARAQLASRMTQTARTRAMAAIRRAHPTSSAREHRLLYIATHYGPDLARRVERDLDRRERATREST